MNAGYEKCDIMSSISMTRHICMCMHTHVHARMHFTYTTRYEIPDARCKKISSIHTNMSTVSPVAVAKERNPLEINVLH